MGTKPTKPIKAVYNPGLIYLTSPPRYSPTTVYYEDGTEETMGDVEIKSLLKKQKKMHLWANVNRDPKEVEESEALEAHFKTLEAQQKCLRNYQTNLLL